jgi:hypothetical protein
MIEQYDDKNGYCRMLGHTLAFRYCRSMNEGLPCHNILNCWFERLEIEQFMAENFSREELRIILKPPEMKIARLVKILDTVRKDSPDAS